MKTETQQDFQPITTAEEMADLVTAAASDNHGVLFPTHLVKSDGDTVGYVSICAMPIVHVWLDSRRVHALQSIRLLRKADAMLRDAGIQSYVIPCSKESPFYAHMERMGFSILGETVLFQRTLNQG